MILLTAILLILLEGIYEGLKAGGHHIASASVEFVFLAMKYTIILAFMSGRTTPFKYPVIALWKIILGYVFLRFGLFDLVWNVSAGQDIFYMGNTKLYDIILSWFVEVGKVAMILVLFVKGMFTVISIPILLNYKQ